jgi:hypothetical protein
VVGLIGVVAVAATVAGSGSAAAAGATGSAVFPYTGAEQVYTVPSGVTMVRVLAVGGAGGAGAMSAQGAGPGGLGADVQADVPVTPGQQLFVEVGGAPGQPGTGGFNGGGDSRNGGGGGGGASDVRTCSRTASSCPVGNDTLTSRLVVAAGGGGGGSPDQGAAHPGGSGGAAGASGTWGTSPPFSSLEGGPGDPGTASAGGGVTQENNVPAAGSSGVFGAGGRGSSVSGQGGGGGGGGWFGGAAGGTSTDSSPAGGGGGGSSYVTANAEDAWIQLATTAVPSIVITPLTPTADPSAHTIMFPSSQVGAAGPTQRVTITDNGQAPLRIDGLALAGTDPEDFAIVSSNCGTPVPIGGACQIMMRFSPQTTGTRQASLVVSSNGLADDVIALTGTGTATSQASPGPPNGTQTCHRFGQARRCTMSFSATVLGLTQRSHVKSFVLRRARTVIRGFASVHLGHVQLHTQTRAAAGKYLLTIWMTHGKKRQLLRQLTVQLR